MHYKYIAILIMSFILSSCKMMPYQSHFDCPIPDGLKCKSLYEVNKLADQGIFEPERDKALNQCCVPKRDR